jgi:hypothetical protein
MQSPICESENGNEQNDQNIFQQPCLSIQWMKRSDDPGHCANDCQCVDKPSLFHKIDLPILATFCREHAAETVDHVAIVTIDHIAIGRLHFQFVRRRP